MDSRGRRDGNRRELPFVQYESTVPMVPSNSRIRRPRNLRGVLGLVRRTQQKKDPEIRPIFSRVGPTVKRLGGSLTPFFNPVFSVPSTYLRRRTTMTPQKEVLLKECQTCLTAFGEDNQECRECSQAKRPRCYPRLVEKHTNTPKTDIEGGLRP